MRLSAFASVKLTIALLSLIGACILIGAWCPQESQVGFQKVVETFGAETAKSLHEIGITDLFHSSFFLALIGLLTVNMIACSVQRVFPKARLFTKKMVFLEGKEISRLQVNTELALKCPASEAINHLAGSLKKQGYKIELDGQKITAEWAKITRLAATVTHIGLLSLLLGVSITSWTGFNGFKPVPVEGVLNFRDSEHSKLWIGKLPEWSVRVADTRREDYESGDPKQWYSKLQVVSKTGKILKEQEISVNNPLSYESVDIYQSSWGLDSIRLSFNGKVSDLPLRQMGGTHAAFMPLDDQSIMIFSLRGVSTPLRVFAKVPEWKEPKMLSEIPQGHAAKFGEVKLAYIRPVPVTGLQYKSDPGLPITYTAFAIIMLGVLMAAFPHRQLWASADACGENECRLYIGGLSHKAKTAFARNIEKTAIKLKDTFGEISQADSHKEANLQDNDIQISAGTTG